MDRDRQIELLTSAKDRVQKTVADWLRDPRVKQSLRKHHEIMKNPEPPLKRACG